MSLNKSLKTALRKQYNLPEKALELIVELEYDEFRREIENVVDMHLLKIDEHQSSIVYAKRAFYRATDYRKTHLVKYYKLPDGTVGFVVIRRKPKIGYESKNGTE